MTRQVEKTNCFYCKSLLRCEPPEGLYKKENSTVNMDQISDPYLIKLMKEIHICAHALFEKIEGVPSKEAPYLYALCKDINDGNCPNYSNIYGTTMSVIST